LDPLTRPADLGNPGTILNLRRGPDPTHLTGVRYLHIPAEDRLENYDTRLRPVRRWLREVLSTLAEPGTPWPVYLHCTSGRDRTGVVVAAALLLLEVPRRIVIEEYLLSEGTTRGPIEQAVRGLEGALADLADPAALRRALLGR
jgi:protein-tyrosine phosphatase